MSQKERSALTEVLNNVNFIAVCRLANTERLSPYVAINRIVQEWTEMTVSSSLREKSSESSTIAIEAKLRHIDSITDDIAQKLKRLSL